MKVQTFGIAVAIALSSAVLAGDRPSSYDKQYDFSGLTSWDFKAQRRISRDPLADNEQWAQRVRDQISTQLLGYGFEPTTATPDFLVAFYIGLREGYAARYMDYGLPGVRLHRPYWWASGWPTPTDIWAIPFTNSTLIIDVIDASSNMLVWRGFDSRTVDMNKGDAALDKGVARVLKQFLDDSGRRPLTDRD